MVSSTLSTRQIPLFFGECQRQTTHELHIRVAVGLANLDRDHANQKPSAVEDPTTAITKEAIDVVQRPFLVICDVIAARITMAVLVIQIAGVANDEYLIALLRVIGSHRPARKGCIDYRQSVVVVIQIDSLDRYRLAID